MLDEVDEQIERFRGEGDGLPVAHEQALGRIQPEGAKLVDGLHGARVYDRLYMAELKFGPTYALATTGRNRLNRVLCARNNPV